MYIGIDVGGTNLKAGLVDENGKILAVERTPLDFRGPESFAATLASLAKAVMASGGVAEKDVEYVGAGFFRRQREDKYHFPKIFCASLVKYLTK